MLIFLVDIYKIYLVDVKWSMQMVDGTLLLSTAILTSIDKIIEDYKFIVIYHRKKFNGGTYSPIPVRIILTPICRMQNLNIIQLSVKI